MKTYLITHIQSKPRVLISFELKNNGDVVISLRSDGWVGIGKDALEVKQHKYSVHKSSKSLNYTTIKQTREFSDRTISTTVGITDAVKKRSGFSNIFCHRFGLLEGIRYDIGSKKHQKINLGSFDPRFGTLTVGLFLGHSKTDFNVVINTKNLRLISIGEYKFVLFYKFSNLPAIPFSWTSSRVTFPPEIFDDQTGRDHMIKRMEGEEALDCLNFFNNEANRLLVNQLETIVSFDPLSETARILREQIHTIALAPSIAF